MHDVLDENLTFFDRDLLEENMKVLKCSYLDIHLLVFQESFHAWQKVLLGVLGTEDLGKLVDRRRQGFLNSQIVNFGQLMIEGLESIPILSSENQNKSWEVE